MMTTRSRLLELLRESPGDLVSGAELARRLGISRAAVWKQIEALRAEGWKIESVRSRGYRIAAAPDLVDEAALRAEMRTRCLGRRVVYRGVTGSTNTDAAELARAGEPEGTVVIADEQTAGRGRLGRTWVSARGVNIYLSVLLRPAVIPAQAPQLALVAGLAVARSLEAYGFEPRIKWPNDVLLEGKKVCGILAEIDAEADRVDFVVLGIGINVNSTREHFPEQLHDKATSLRMVGGNTLSRAPLAARVLQELEAAYDVFQRHGFAPLAAQWNARSALTRRCVEVSCAGMAPLRGACVGIDADGALLLDTAAGRERVLAGDVTVVGGYDG